MAQALTYHSTDALGRAAAALFRDWALDSLAQKGRFRVALSGGRGPRGMFAALGPETLGPDWRRVELYWVDERSVDWGSPESNYGEARRLWLDRMDPTPQAFAMVQPGATAQAAAAAYARLLEDRLGAGPPVFDAVLLGMGPDGHTASLFPGQASLAETGRICLPVRHPATGQERVTLTLPVLNAALRCAFLVTGADKAATLERVLSGAAPDLPAARVRPTAGPPLWLVARD